MALPIHGFRKIFNSSPGFNGVSPTLQQKVQFVAKGALGLVALYAALSLLKWGWSHFFPPNPPRRFTDARRLPIQPQQSAQPRVALLPLPQPAAAAAPPFPKLSDEAKEERSLEILAKIMEKRKNIEELLRQDIYAMNLISYYNDIEALERELSTLF